MLKELDIHDQLLILQGLRHVGSNAKTIMAFLDEDQASDDPVFDKRDEMRQYYAAQIERADALQTALGTEAHIYINQPKETA